MSLGAYAPLVADTRSFTENPAGIVNMRDWDLSLSTYLPTQGSTGFVFQGLAIGKRIVDNVAVALEYSQGTALEFTLPTPITQIDTNPISADKRINYQMPIAAAAAVKLLPEVSAGVAGRYIKQRVTESQYRFVVDSGYFSLLPDQVSELASWDLDVGVKWEMSRRISLSMVGRSLLHITSGELPADLAQYELPHKGSIGVGSAVTVSDWLALSAAYSSSGNGGLGAEWTLGSGLALRSGIYFQPNEDQVVPAAGVGFGWTFRFFTADCAYLHFFAPSVRGGTLLARDFDAGAITNLEFNRYTGDRIQFSLKAMFGDIRESLANIEAVHITGSVYPSSYATLAFRPIGSVSVKNISAKPIEARAGFFVDRFMDAPTESEPVYLAPGERREIPIKAVFNEKIKSVERMVVREANVFVSATPAGEYDDKFTTPVLIHGKNDWDGDVHTLRYFVTPDDPLVIKYTRDVLLKHKDSLANVAKELEPLQKARILFNEFAGNLVYINDPKQSGDYVQYPAETLQLRGGDCDDFTTCFSSLLSSIGISTAFVDVIPPQDSSRSHIYLLFDTGIDPKYGQLVSPNPKRFVTRKGPKGNETIWLPVETTVISRGFETAWAQGAQEYFDDVEIGLGLIKGWVKIVDVY